MSFAMLDGHETIGWDFDETLILHQKSSAMHEYILAHPEKTHYIVTFRSHGLLRILWPNLREYPSAPPKSAFAGVLSIPPEMWSRYTLIEHSAADDHPDIVNYVEWKGKTCVQHGITVLVDDDVKRTLEGCTKHGIMHVHPDNL